MTIFPLLSVSFAVVLAAWAGAPLRGQISDTLHGAAPVIQIKVETSSDKTSIPSTIFGVFLEPIGNSIYGGLWSDVLDNPSFEDGLWSVGNLADWIKIRPELRRASDLGLPTPWEPLKDDQGARYLPVWGDAANSNRSLLIMGLPGEEVGVRQKVYLSVQRELSYTGSIWLKHLRGPAAVTVSLRARNRSSDILASVDLEADSSDWRKYPFQFQLKQGQVARLDPVDFVISVHDDARFLIDEASLMPADNIDGLEPDLVALLRDLHTPILRFGGNFTSAYDWHDGVGPRDKRVSKINVSWGSPEYNTFGTDELLELCQLIHAQPQIALNLGTGTPELAANWVQYVNAHWTGQKGGLVWELGNELWGNFQEGYPTQGKIAALTKAASDAVRRVDPQVKLIATGGDTDGFQDWNAAQLSNPPSTFDFLSTHFVVTDDAQLHNPSCDFLDLGLLAEPVAIESKLHLIHDQVQRSTHKDRVTTAFTEWVVVSNQQTCCDSSNLGGAIFAGAFLNMLLRNSDVVPISDMSGCGIAKNRGQAYGQPNYWVLREYASSHPQTLLPVKSDSPTYSISHGINRLPEVANVPYLDVVAAKSTDAKELTLFCVNRHLTQTLAAQFDFTAIGNFSGKKAKVDTISSDSVLEANSDENPNFVVPVITSETVSLPYVHRFPGCSVTVIHIPLN